VNPQQDLCNKAPLNSKTHFCKAEKTWLQLNEKNRGRAWEAGRCKNDLTVIKAKKTLHGDAINTAQAWPRRFGKDIRLVVDQRLKKVSNSC
jgi:hypothetical protein